MTRKLWRISIYRPGQQVGQTWFYPSIKPRTAIDVLLSEKERDKITAGYIVFRQATKEELAAYLKSKGKDEI